MLSKHGLDRLYMYACENLKSIKEVLSCVINREKENEMENEMFIITAIKDIRVKEKRIADNSAMITEYSSILSSERPLFGTEEEQAKKVASLV